MRNRYLLAIDLPLIAFAAFSAFGLRFDLLFLQEPGNAARFAWFAAAALTIKPAVFMAFGLYYRYWRYASIGDLLAIVLSVSAATAALAVLLVVATLLHVVEGFSRSVLFIDWLLTLALVGGTRLSVRVVGEAWRRGGLKRAEHGSARLALIVGAGAAGTMVAREMYQNPQLGLTPAGFLDDDAAKQGKRILGIPVLGSTSELARVATERGIDEVLIAMPTAAGTVLRQIADKCRENGLTSRTIPGVFELVDGVVSVTRLRQIDIADLLRRAQVTSSRDASHYLSGRSVLVTGAGGSIGFELCRQLGHASPSRLILLGHGENSIFDAEVQLRELFPRVQVQSVIADIRERRRVESIFDALRPAVVFHAAAHKHVPLMEANPEEAVTNNVFGTANIVRAALSSGAERLVVISTDKAVAPRSLMGASKRVAEIIVRDAARRSGRAFMAVRFGNVLGSRGSVVPHFKRQIETGGPITITHPEMTRFFMTIPEAVHLTLQAGGLGSGGELFVLNMGEPVRILDLARDLIKLSGYEADEIPIAYTGIRPGEKLHEALWENDAKVHATEHPDILRVEEQEHSVDLPRMLESLEAAAGDGSRLAVQAALAQWIETFAPAPDIAHGSLQWTKVEDR
jgi:FlaA1/EpsC-like NDP-sugar epimerase